MEVEVAKQLVQRPGIGVRRKEASELSRKYVVQELSLSWLFDQGEGNGYMTESESDPVKSTEHKD